MHKLSIQDLPLKSQKILMRVDFNVPLNDKGEIADDTRIRSSINTIEYAINQGASVILMSHLGRPKGKKESKFSLRPVAKRLSELLAKEVAFTDDAISISALQKAKDLKEGEVLLLENLRFYDAEEHPEKDPSFADKLASMGDLYVTDAFATAHRKHSSTYALPKLFPGKAAAGFLVDKEIAFLSKLVEQPKRPFYAIVGGAKISSKLGALKSLTNKVDGLFIGGAMVFTFMKANGEEVGDSLVEDDQIENAKEIIKLCQERAVKFYLPSDLVIADSFHNDAQKKTVSIKEKIPDGWQGMDIGPKTVIDWKELLANGETIFWNGPLGVFEMEQFAQGTNQLARILAEISATTVVGGGDSIHAIQKLSLQNHFTHLSTGGGASLEYIEEGHLPGIDVLSDR